VEKLEKILHAEDTARTAAADARVEAMKIVGDARTQAAELARTSREETHLLASERREEILGDARDAAASLAAAGEQELAGLRATAADRHDAALSAVLTDVKGT